jgi:3D (Asp-Asp-Asp) domain-containing protein
MRFYLKQNLIIEIFLVFFSILGIFFQFPLEAGKMDFDFNLPESVVLGEDTLVAIINPQNPEPKIIKRLNVILTAYSSSPWETDGDPHITAAGTKVRYGIVANNLLPLGTKIKIPEIFGDEIFVVEDRMSWKKGKYQVDVWFDDYFKAKEFGAKKTYIEILED